MATTNRSGNGETVATAWICEGLIDESFGRLTEAIDAFDLAAAYGEIADAARQRIMTAMR
jgi:hypothetical protein